MAQTLTKLLIHVIFSTKHRADVITPEIESELHAYMGGIVRGMESPALAINGTANHVHLLISLSKNVTLSGLLAPLKKDSSLWIKTKGSEFRDFHWQDGYAGFSVGESQVEAVRRYLARQKQHHKRVTFQEELLAFLKKYNVAYDERYIWR